MSLEWLQYSIPAFTKESSARVLVILFGRHFESKSRQLEAIDLLESHARFGMGTHNVHWPAYVYIHRIQDDRFDNPGSATDIYELSAIAKANGWKALMFFDELSWRQHERTLTNVEDPMLSATVVNLYCSSSAAILSPQTTFFIRRLPLGMAFTECWLAEPQDFCPPRNTLISFDIRLRDGFYLFDPHQPIFSASDCSDGTAVVQRQVIDQKTSLPEELKQQILSEAKPDLRTPLPNLMDCELDDTDVPFLQPLVQIDPTRLPSIKESIRTKLGIEEDIRVGEWKLPTPATRIDVSRLLDRETTFHKILHHPRRQRRVIYLLKEPQGEEEPDIAVNVLPHAYFVSPSVFKMAIFRRLTCKELSEEWQERNSGDDFGWEYGREKNKRLEVFVDPLVFFPPTFPPRMLQSIPKIKTARLRTVEDRDRFIEDVPHWLIFYLTNLLTEAEKHSIKMTVNSVLGDENSALFIPWEKAKDGGLDDTLHALKLIERADDWDYLGHYTSKLGIFIDKQSAGGSLRPIVARWRQVAVHANSGMEYARLNDADHFTKVLLKARPNWTLFDHIFADLDASFLKDPDYEGPLEPPEGGIWSSDSEDYIEELESEDE